MANTLLTIQMITRESARVLVNNLGFAKKVNREYDDQFAKNGAKIGNTLNIRKPPRYAGRTGDAMQIEDAVETSVPLVLTTKFGIDLAFGITDLVLSIDDFSKRFLKPQIAKIANRLDFDGTQLYQTVNNCLGTPGAVPNTALLYLQVNQRLSEEACPFEDRSICITPAMNASIVDALKGLFQDGAAIKEQYNKGMMGRGLGYDGWYLDQNLRTHTVGPLGGTPLVNGSNQSGSSLVTDGWTAAAANRLKKGDVFTIGTTVKAVNPQSLQSTGTLRQFVVTADVSSDGSGNATIPIYPPIIASGPFATVTNVPVDNDAITVVGAASTATPQGMAFHPDAFTLAMADLLLPRGVHVAERVSDKQLGISIRYIEAYDINMDRMPGRTDILYGYAPIYPELACRIAS
jgi:hypothetical protein